MAGEKEKEKDKKRKPKAAVAKPVEAAVPQTSGEFLRQARIARGLGLEEVSSSIHIRVSQLRAIEEGNIEALPGMTYAMGFVRSYAQFLKLNPTEITQKFKAEHGAAATAARPELHFPEPIPESRMPDPTTIGIAAFCAILLLVFWSIFSGGDDEDITAALEIPPAPLEGSAPLLTSMAETAPAPLVGSPSAAAVLPEETTAPAPLAVQEPPAPLAAPPAAVDVSAVAETPAAAVPYEAVDETVINVSPARGRIVLRARQSSWVQINDANQKTIFKKVLKPGEQFVVPDQKGLSMVTSNAGGLEIMVDGAKTQSIGKPGEILRGVQMNPENLKKKRVKVSNY